MKNQPENIEEKLIPFIEGVLNAREQSEVAEAIEADPNLAREVQDLKEVIVDLREAFASGVRPPQEELSPEEVVLLASHDGQLASMKGTADQKSRLFANDQSMAEYEMLRSLTEEMKRTTMAMEDIPPMPEALLAEFKALKSTPRPAVQELSGTVTSLSFWKRTTLFVDRIDPRPLMATAAALAVISLGIHSFNKSSRVGQEAPQVSYASPAAEMASTFAGDKGTGSGEPSGVTVFTSGDRALLKEQAEKLLAKKVRYTVTEDRILVSEKELAQAREVLWGEEGATQVAVAEEKSVEESLRTQGDKPERLEDPSPTLLPEIDAANEHTPVTRYNVSSPRRVEAEGEAAPRVDDDAGRSGKAEVAPAPQWAKPSEDKASARTAEEGTGTASTSVSPRQSSNYEEARKQKLRDLALGQAKEGDEEPAVTQAEVPAPAPAPVDLGDFTHIGKDQDEPTKVTMNRARNAPEPSVLAVPNAVTAKSAPHKADDALSMESSGGSVAARTERPSPPAGASGLTRSSKAPVSPVAAVRAEPAAESSGPSDLRLAGVLRSQAQVARQHNVILSVESDGGAIKVYVRPKNELTKSEIDALRQAIRSDLGLNSEDSIIFR